MNEQSFRSLYRRAIGEAPPAQMTGRILQAINAPPARHEVPRLAVALAGLLTITLIAGLVGPRLWRTSNAQPPAVASAPNTLPATSPTALNYLDCTLPVIVMRSSGPPASMSIEAGFISTKTGTYTKDSASTLAGLPGGGSPGSDMKPSASAQLSAYSPSARRWVPVMLGLSPDGLSYAWTKWLPEGSTTTHFQSNELHVFDMQTLTDRVVWTYAGSITVSLWDSNGILVNTVPPTGGVQLWWRVDPKTASAVQQPASADPSHLSLQPDDMTNFSRGYGSLPDGHGLVMFRMGSRSPGDQEWVFFQKSSGERVTIYKGTQGDAMGFDPYGVQRDATGIWFGDYAGGAIWHWDSQSGLHKFAISGLPSLPEGQNAFLATRPAGGCFS